MVHHVQDSMAVRWQAQVLGVEHYNQIGHGILQLLLQLVLLFRARKRAGFVADLLQFPDLACNRAHVL